ncbi:MULTISPECIES: hypothetical protein [unclassified Nocardiopsis]|uniref:hypothetical protein n=1 Tax=unclassified Nocardiopsis TaxID=2649073 RepID=UPI0013571835|nr:MULTISPECIES: hypothetical protein [unclassified Nocardiopsis]
MATAAVAGIGLRGAQTVLAVAFLAGARLAAAWYPTGSHAESPMGVLTQVSVLLWVTLVAWLASRLFDSYRRLRESGRGAGEAEVRRAVERARRQEREAQRRVLHETALATLTAIARGGLDHRTAQVRARCASDAVRLRLLLQGKDAGPPDGLRGTLADTARQAHDLGAQVHVMCGTSPRNHRVRSCERSARRPARR